MLLNVMARFNSSQCGQWSCSFVITICGVGAPGICRFWPHPLPPIHCKWFIFGRLVSMVSGTCKYSTEFLSVCRCLLVVAMVSSLLHLNCLGFRQPLRQQLPNSSIADELNYDKNFCIRICSLDNLNDCKITPKKIIKIFLEVN